MSNLIPPLLSSSPPPIVGSPDEDDDDEFGDFRAAADSYDCDDLSLPPSPQKSPEKELKLDATVSLDINCNKSQKITNTTEMPTQNVNGSIFNQELNKDFQDRRKSVDDTEPEITSSNSQSVPVDEGGTGEQIVDEPELESDAHSCKSSNSNTLEEDFSDLQCAVASSAGTCDVSHSNHDALELEPCKSIKEGGSDLNSFSNEENLFENFSESVQERTSNSDNLSELNETIEIKSEISEDRENVIPETDSKETNEVLSETDLKLSDDEFGDFANFDTEEVEKQFSEDEFDDFVNPPTAEDQQGDDFGDFESSDFADFTSQTCERPSFLDIDEKNAANKSELILKEIFPSLDIDVSEFEFIDGTKGNTVFDELKDVTESNALIYQWSKSNSQKMFFKALNIDTRNILYGPAWNTSMPRFAANLGLTPLEPVRTEILTPTPVQNVSSPSNSSQKSNGDIPTAQFDWSGSGLINPLDSTSADPLANVPEESSQSQPQSDFLPTKIDKPEPLPSLFDTAEPKTSPEVELPKPEPLDNFSPFQSPKLIPLRETHISESNDGKPGWLQPTIVTPDLPRKEAVMDPDDDDEFDDFQMVLPEENKETEVKNDAFPLPDLSEFVTVPSIDKTPRNQEHIFGISLNSGPINTHNEKNSASKDDDDEFTEFHSSVPPPNQIFKPLQPVPLEPLKPTVQYSQPTQINWPDPGVTDEDIKNIELTYSRKTEPKEEVKAVKKDSSLEDDEWTDFVSVTNPVKPMLPERTATPDLPLSVLNLNHVQAPKQPIPVITPSGLVQTKLSSNMTLQPKSVVQKTVQPALFKPPSTMFQPSIISSQYAANFGPTTTTPAPSIKTQDDDEDWSDFVSSQPPPQVNGYQQKPPQKVPQVNWANATTNIIMNPTHFEAFQSYVPPQNRKVSPMPPRSVIPSISAIPDLDFIAPKNRTSKK